MPTANYSPSSAAAAVGVSPGTIRAWCSQFRAHLSPKASPDAGKERVLTAGDVAKLQMIKGWRDEGLEVTEILDRLAIEPTAPLQPFIDVPAVPRSQAAPPGLPETHSTALAQNVGVDSPLALQAFVGRLDAIERAQKDRFTWFLYGFLACGVIFGLMLLLAVLFGR